MQKTKILVTGGAGYLGSHMTAQLMSQNYDVVIFDNFSNSQPAVVDRIEKIVGRRPIVFQGDVRSQDQLEEAVQNCRAVVHFAALKSVAESVQFPDLYYQVNVGGTLNLLNVMERAGVQRLVFSSSATVYGEPTVIPIPETHRTLPASPYGDTKLQCEQSILQKVEQGAGKLQAAILRYFNPVGAHPSGLIGEDPRSTPNNLMPIVAEVALGRRQSLNIWGSDYSTKDGTGIRDYIHVMDLIDGHMAALKQLEQHKSFIVNLGTGTGYSVLELVQAFESVSGKKINFNFAPRRPGDVASSVADVQLASHLLQWRATRGLSEMCRDSWRWINQGHGPNKTAE